jgi:UDP-GlcNAc:undecaprenyl-phosphate GlcNAc-1-phosphate transferase
VLTDLGHLVSTERFTLGSWSVLMTVVATVGVINSMNMADGLDGLAGTLALVTLSVTALLAFGAHAELSEIALITCSALVAYLAFNAPLPGRHPGARIFMGDAGSMMLGLLIAWLMIALSQGPERAFPPITALWLFALPLLDTLTVMLRRVLRGRSPFSPDREHLHHVLIVAGYSKRMVVVIAVGAALLFAGLGLTMLHLGIADYVQFFIALGVFGLINLAVRRAWRLQRWLHKT